MKHSEIKKVVREGYGKIAKTNSSCCAPTSSCCGGSSADDTSRKIGYTDEELSSVPEGANLGLGCGNPVAFASLKKGETVMDLGSGPGFDCFLAANKVGKSGKVIGIDMTPEMLDRARENARKGNYKNVEFRLGEIENLPAADNSVDAVISNCVINLAPDKKRVFKEAFRVLKPGGRLMVSDIVLTKELPDNIKDSMEAYIGCIAGAISKDEYIMAIKYAGFRDVRIVGESYYLELMNDPGIRDLIEKINIPPDVVKEIAESMVSVKVQGMK
ncbi:MAG: arsenite methyltransferase [Candidatus Methanoperedens sp.]|jgi:arsenite methyltransferase|nr:arsenite methyltransferase [Candidatus Methanoperedens sp.]